MRTLKRAPLIAAHARPLAGPCPRILAAMQAASLLLLALKHVPEALAQFETHLRLFRCGRGCRQSFTSRHICSAPTPNRAPALPHCCSNFAPLRGPGHIHDLHNQGGCGAPLALKQCSASAVAPLVSFRPAHRRLPFQAQPGLLAAHHAWICR